VESIKNISFLPVTSANALNFQLNLLEGLNKLGFLLFSIGELIGVDYVSSQTGQPLKILPDPEETDNMLEDVNERGRRRRGLCRRLGKDDQDGKVKFKTKWI